MSLNQLHLLRKWFSIFIEGTPKRWVSLQSHGPWHLMIGGTPWQNGTPDVMTSGHGLLPPVGLGGIAGRCSDGKHDVPHVLVAWVAPRAMPGDALRGAAGGQAAEACARCESLTEISLHQLIKWRHCNGYLVAHTNPKEVISLAIRSGISRVDPLITRVITCYNLLTKWDEPPSKIHR
jgi:hypothetical protein